MASLTLDQTIDQYHQAMGEIFKGNPRPLQKLFTEREDVCLANLFGPAVHGRKQVVEAVGRAAANFRDGQPARFETTAKVVTSELAFIVETERASVKIGGRQDLSPIALRVTTIFRLEEGAWRVVHRHADPIATDQPAESVLQK